jgi:hypothetical protein
MNQTIWIKSVPDLGKTNITQTEVMSEVSLSL